MCFSPQLRTILRHQHLQKCSEDCSFLTFALPNVLFATAACNFWFCRWPPDSAPAALTGLLFDWPDTRINEKNTAFRDFSNIYRGCIFFHLTLTLLHLLSTDLTTLLLLFNSPYCRKFLFKLPSTTTTTTTITTTTTTTTTATTTTTTTGVSLQPHQILRLPRKRNVMIEPHHMWNVIYNARSDRHHPATSPDTAPATQNCTPKS